LGRRAALRQAFRKHAAGEVGDAEFAVERTQGFEIKPASFKFHNDVPNVRCWAKYFSVSVSREIWL